jgi:two-component sensor histidine kinase
MNGTRKQTTEDKGMSIDEAIDNLRTAHAEAVELADGEAVDACIILLEAVENFLAYAANVPA